ncbi:glycopeptide antibiotics resistance protein [Actinomadura verrucosospora]|uniref:Glycopeptide antibiotics resistance protein n=1 Tax=Actinomadura verrucosospora TaxID=46165 RepID=A0A7D4AVD0_ACTVE|nr:glycopeptide antibiotics resistance protein [Actinomadura verrucosospora]
MPTEVVRQLALWALIAAAVALLRRPVVRRTGWAPLPALTLLAWTGLVLAITLPTTVAPGAGARLEHCVATPVSDVVWSLRIFGSRGLEDVMNVALWVPLGFLGALLTRRPAAAAAAFSAGFVLVEFLQTLDPGRECDPGDMAYNSIGVAAGALTASAFLRIRAAVADRSAR